MNEILIYGRIGANYWDDEAVSARSVIDQLTAANGQDVTVRINSNGGDVVDGTAIYSALLSYSGHVTVQIDGYAMSMASIIAMAGDTVKISESGMFMIHSPWSFAVGNAKEMRKEADVLDQIEGALIKAYMRRMDKSEDELREMLAEDTWIGAEEAIELGLADSTIEPLKMAACFDKKYLAEFKNVPDAVLAQLESEEEEADPVNPEPEPEPEPEPTPQPLAEDRALAILQACNKAGLGKMAEGWIADKSISVDNAKMMICGIKAGLEENQDPPQPNHPHVAASNDNVWAAAHSMAGIQTKQ